MAKTKIDRSIDTEALGFQIRESYKTARTNIAYSIIKKRMQKNSLYKFFKGRGKNRYCHECSFCPCSAG